MYRRLIMFLALVPVMLASRCGKDPDTVVSTVTGLPRTIMLKDLTGGSFTMGGTTVENDAPEVTVTVSSFKISEKEITNEEYVEFLNAAIAAGLVAVEVQQVTDPCGTNTENVVVGSGNSPHSGKNLIQLAETGGCTSNGEAESIENKSWIAFNDTSNSFSLLDAAKATRPVNWVTWDGASAFAAFYGVSLPTEAQWEFAARGGQQLEFPTDDGTLDATKANFNGDIPNVHNATGHSFAVGTFAANPFGLFDMGGNVWEWCEDYYDPNFYTNGAVDPKNETPGANSERVKRGGSWNFHSATLRTFARDSDIESRGNNHFGFRIVIND